MLFDRDSAAVGFHGHAAVLVDGQLDFGAPPRHSFVDGIIHDFIDKVMKPSRADIPDIHRRTFPDSFQSFQNLNLSCTVTFGILILHVNFYVGFRHGNYLF